MTAREQWMDMECGRKVSLTIKGLRGERQLNGTLGRTYQDEDASRIVMRDGDGLEVAVRFSDIIAAS